MKNKIFPKLICDGNEAVAIIAHKTNEVCAIYPITPSSPMGEHAELYSSKGKKNIWNNIPKIVELIDRVLSDFTNETTIEAVRKEVNALVSGRPLFKW